MLFFRHSFRTLWKTPGSTFIAIASIALGIGANTAVFSALNAILLKPLPYVEPERIVVVWGTSVGEGSLNQRNQVSATDIADVRKQNDVFDEVTTFTDWFPILSGAGAAERIPAIQVGDGFFKIMKSKPLLGRVFLPEEQQEGKDYVIVLSYGLWRSQFGKDPEILKKTVLLNGRPYKVVGVMPPDFHPLPSRLVNPEGQFYRPVAEAYDESQRDSRHLRAIARLKPNVPLQRAQAEMKVLAKRLEQAHPESNMGRGLRVVSLSEDTVGNLKRPLIVLLGAVLFVLMIACLNVGNLLLVRAGARQREMAIRSAIGGTRSAIAGQLIAESLLLSFCGGLFGVLLAYWGIESIGSLSAQIDPLFLTLKLDWHVLIFTTITCVLSGIAFGLAPVMQVSKVNLTEALKEGAAASTSGPGRTKFRSGLILVEVAITMVLLLCAGLFIKTVLRLQRVNPGFNAEKVLTMNIGLPTIRYPKEENWIRFYHAFIERVERIPGVSSAAIVSVLPLSQNFDGRGVLIEDHPRPPGQAYSVDLYSATPDYLRTMQIPLIEGRAISTHDTEDSMNVVLINETMARQFWPKKSALGRRIKIDGPPASPWRTIVGIVHDVSQYALDEKPPMQMYVPYKQFPLLNDTLVVRGKSDPVTLLSSIRKELTSMDPQQAVSRVATMEELTSKSISLQRLLMVLLMLFAGVALSLAAIGIFGVFSYSISQQKREIGIRLAVGATGKNVFRMVVRQAMKLAIAGIFIGIVAAMLATRFLETLLYEVRRTDLNNFISTSIILLAVALLACLVPAYRAMKVDPMISLRSE